MAPPDSNDRLINPLPPIIQRPVHVPDTFRLTILAGLVLAMLCVIVGRLWYLQVAMGGSFAVDANRQRTRPIRRIAARGMITDAKGRVLAATKPQYVVTVLPQEISKNPAAVNILAAILDVPVESILNKLTDPPAPAAPGRRERKAPAGPRWKTGAAEPIKVADNLDMKTVTQIEEQKLDLDGVQVTRQPVRCYVESKLCAHIIGRTYPIPPDKQKEYKARGYHDSDLVGAEGLEKTYQEELRGTDGAVFVTVDARNRMIRRVSDTAPVAGDSLKLNIDLSLQRTAYVALQDTLAHGHPGSAVALDPNTGAVLAMVSTPSFDINSYSRDFAKLMVDPTYPLYNRVTRGAYPCGSTFKLITGAAGLESGKITDGTRIHCSGALQVGNRTFRCDGRHGDIDIESAIAKSCDVYFYNVGLTVEQGRIEAMAKRFGLGDRTGIDLPGEAAGVVPGPAYKLRHGLDAWQRGDTVNLSIGQGYLQVTPLQLADYTAALANGGTLWRPQLVKEVRDSAGNLVRRPDPEKRRELGLTPKHRDLLVRGMERVVEPGGTASNIAIPGLRIAAKTGTAQTGIGRDNSVFICFAPVDHPKIAIAVLIEKVGHGNEFAGPVARRMLLQYFGLNPDQTRTMARR
ncbi:MAG TPA: penicillin-binding protein 2 [Chthonomonadaceae bacterium]|nr:penicillin-binding protein 2 [Chthonomonadaceae bacterium]